MGSFHHVLRALCSHSALSESRSSCFPVGQLRQAANALNHRSAF